MQRTQNMPHLSMETVPSSVPIEPAWKWLHWLGTDRAIVLLTLLIAIVGHSITEKIGINGGLGWDGGVYASWVQDLPGAIQKGIGSYHVQKLLPVALAHYGLRLFNESMQERHVIRAFVIINIIGATLVAWLWCKIASELKISDRGKWLGFAGLILNFAMTKNAFFYPVLTDVPAMALSTAMCYFYLRGWQIGLLATILIGAFTSPLLIYIGSVLVLFPRRAELDACVEPAPMRLNLVFAGLAAYYFALWSLYVVRDIEGPLFGWLAPVESVLPLSFALLLAYLGIGLAMVLNNRRLFQPKSYWTRGNGWAVLGLIATLMAVKLIKAALMGRENDFDSRIYYLILGVASVAKPAVSFLAATIFFGPLVLLAAFLWRPVCGLVHAHGLGLTIVIALGLAHSVDSESRHVAYLIPLLFPFVVKAVEDLRWRPGQYALIVALAVISTKTWLLINGNFINNSFMYPDQLYMMHLGPFLGNEMYLAHLAGIGVAALLIYIVCFQQQSATSVASSADHSTDSGSHSHEAHSQSRAAA